MCERDDLGIWYENTWKNISTNISKLYCVVCRKKNDLYAFIKHTWRESHLKLPVFVQHILIFLLYADGKFVETCSEMFFSCVCIKFIINSFCIFKFFYILAMSVYDVEIQNMLLLSLCSIGEMYSNIGHQHFKKVSNNRKNCQSLNADVINVPQYFHTLPHNATLWNLGMCS